MLFDDIPRDFKGPCGHTEPHFNYLNRSARPSMIRIRQRLKSWFREYPSQTQAELEARFRSLDDIQHRSAFFELYLHALLIQLDFQIRVHPEIPESDTHPEFLVFRVGKPIFYLEATFSRQGPAQVKRDLTQPKGTCRASSRRGVVSAIAPSLRPFQAGGRFPGSVPPLWAKAIRW
jgi:hypothetical protein